MRVGNYTVTIEGGRELDNGYIAVKDGSPYAPVLRNHDWKRCDAVLTIDGKEIQTFRLNPHQSLRIEGPPDDPQKGRWTFYAAGSAAAAKAGEGEVAKNEKGLITVVFKPERREQPTLNDAIGDVMRTPRRGQWPVKPTDMLWSSGVPQYGASSEAVDGGVRHTMSCEDTKSVNVCEAFSAIETERSGGKITTQGLKAGITGLSGHTDQKWDSATPIEYDESTFVTFNIRLVVAEDGPRPLAAKGRTTPVPPPVG